jgi:phage replication O-like protein O
MSGFTSPNHTQCPNDLFDVHMLDMSEAELKVTLAIIRKTLGFHKKSDPISLSQLQKLTGLSRQGVSDGVAAAIERGLVEIVGTGKRGVLIYGLVINSDQSTELTSEGNDQSKIQTGTGQQIRPVTSQKFRHTKERDTKETSQKKKEKKENAPNGAEPPIEIVKSIPPKKRQWADEDCIIDVWAGIRKLDAIAMGADYHTDSDRKKAKKMLAWTKPITPDEIRDAMKASKYKGEYPFAFLEKDILEMRAKKAMSAPAVPNYDDMPKPTNPRIVSAEDKKPA